MQLTYDEITDTLYIYFSQEPVARTDEISERIIVDYDARGAIRGIEFIGASDGSALSNVQLPRADDVARLMQKARELPVAAISG